MKMKVFVAAAFLAALAATSAQAQPMEKSGPVCLRPFDSPDDPVDHTHVVNPQTVLFYMRDGKVWKNTLKSPCPGLMLHGFTFVTHQDEICDNAQAIQVIESGEVCELGSFTPYAPAKSMEP
jgi:hypothetical protein